MEPQLFFGDPRQLGLLISRRTWLVSGKTSPLKNYGVSVGMMTFPIYEMEHKK